MNMINDLPNTKFFEEIERLCRKENLEYIDAIVYYCEKNSLDVESIGKAISKNPLMKSKLTEEAEEHNYISKTKRLPI